ncbi:MAG: transposase [Chloroflexi bacterium]|nr:transposase [Chloroflexota bacterium]
MKRRTYDDEFKRDAVAMVIRSGRPSAEVGRELGVCGKMLSRWKLEHLARMDQSCGALPETGMTPSEVEAENRKLRRELAYVSEQRDILKKAISIFSQEGNGHTNS